MKKSLVTFWWTKHDEDAFLQFATRDASVLAFTAAWKPSRDAVQSVELAHALKSPERQALLFGRADQVCDDHIQEHHFSKAGRLFNVTAESGNLMWWRHSVRADGKLTLVTVGFYPEREDSESGMWVSKSADFTKWARSVLRWIRGRTPCRDGDYRCSTLVQSARLAGSVELAIY